MTSGRLAFVLAVFPRGRDHVQVQRFSRILEDNNDETNVRYHVTLTCLNCIEIAVNYFIGDITITKSFLRAKFLRTWLLALVTDLK